jgi:hypothetical protein
MPALLAGVAMYAGVRALGEVPMPSQVLMLVAQLIAGAGIYVATGWSIWRARGYPDGAERQAANRVRSAWAQWQRKTG